MDTDKELSSPLPSRLLWSQHTGSYKFIPNPLQVDALNREEACVFWIVNGKEQRPDVGRRNTQPTAVGPGCAIMTANRCLGHLSCRLKGINVALPRHARSGPPRLRLLLLRNARVSQAGGVSGVTAVWKRHPTKTVKPRTAMANTSHM